MKNSDASLKHFDSSSPVRKRYRFGAHTQVEEDSKEKRAQNIPLSGHVLMKAGDSAKQPGVTSYKPNTDCLERLEVDTMWFRSISGESAEVNADIENEWLNNK